MTSSKRTAIVNGETYEFWGDFFKKGTIARNTQTEEIKQISYSGYVSNELTVRKAIASAFRLPTFRKTQKV